MSETWVVNASPVIALAKVHRLDLLRSGDRLVLLPTEVVEEIMRGSTEDPARQAVAGGWGSRASPKNVPNDVVEWGLGSGESAVIALARERHATAVLDDREARACAKTLGIPVVGTLAVVIGAKRRGQIPSAIEVMAALRQAGFRIDDGVVRRALREAVAEDWPS